MSSLLEYFLPTSESIFESLKMSLVNVALPRFIVARRQVNRNRRLLVNAPAVRLIALSAG